MNLENMTWRQAVKRWNSGDTVWSAELGGIGPGYEQAIQILLWTILARWPETLNLSSDSTIKKYPDDYTRHVHQVVAEIDDKCGGLTGAQVDAAKSTAYQFMVYGYSEMMAKLEDDRKILVSKDWPTS